MTRPLPVHFTSTMTAQDVRAAVRASIERGLSDAPGLSCVEDRNPVTSADEFLDEVRVWLADTTRFSSQTARPEGGCLVADSAARLRDRAGHQVGDYRGLAHHAGLMGHWLFGHAARESFEKSLRAAVRAADGAAEEQSLGRDLRALIAGRIDGSISDDRFVRMLKSAQKKALRAERGNELPARVDDPAAITPGSVLAILDDRLARSGPHVTVQACWETFTAIAVLPLVWTDQADDLLLFECSTPGMLSQTAGAVGTARLVRQFEVLDADGIADHVEQLSIEWSFDPRDLPMVAEAGPIWSDGNIDAWCAVVERNEIFAAMLAHNEQVMVVTELAPTD